MSKENTITIDNVGPITHTEIPVNAGQVTVLRGRNGVGKSIGLEAVRRHTTGRGDTASPTDGEAKGKIEGLGVTMTIGASRRRKGVAEVTELSDGLSVADIVDPGMKTPEANDKRRINALLRTVGAEADAKLFAAHLDESLEIDKVTQARTRRSDDLVEMAKLMRADFEESARVDEDQVVTLTKAIESREAMLGDKDPDAEVLTVADAQKAWVKAEQELSDAKARRDMAVKVSQKANNARAELDDIDEADLALAGELDGLISQVADIDDKLRQLKEQRDAVQVRYAKAKEIAKHMKSLQAVVDAATVDDAPSEADIDTLAEAVTEAEQGVQQAVIAENARKLSGDIEADREQLAKITHRAEALRKAAKATDQVLSEAVLKVVPWACVTEGRLMIHDERRGKLIPFDELSTGQKWRTALRVAIEAAGRLKPDVVLFVLPQDAWQDLDNANRQVVVDAIKGTNVAIVTAEWNDSETLEAEALS